MKRFGYWLCALLATAVAVWMLYRYGISPLTLLLLTCPVIVIWLSLRQARQTEREIEAAVCQERANRSQTESGRKP